MTTKSAWMLPVCAALTVLVSHAAKGETLNELYDKAKAEKEVVFYSGGPAAPHENRAKLFMQQYPAIDVKVTGGFSNVLNEIIEKQMAEKKLQVDDVLPDGAGLCEVEGPGQTDELQGRRL